MYIHVEVITSLEAVSELRQHWDAVYEADPEAQFFLSWTWMSGWLKSANSKWFILAAKADYDASAYIAFFPLRHRVKTTSRGTFYKEITLGGNCGADYTGFICIPAFEDRALIAFAACIKRLNWPTLNLEFIRASHNRLRRFTGEFPTSLFSLTEVGHVSKIDNVNNCICPFVSLPADGKVTSVTAWALIPDRRFGVFLEK